MSKELPERKNLELDRLVFFSDAVVAIAITLLALDLKIQPAVSNHITFEDLAGGWQKFVAFLLSFGNIAVFWKIHHQFFVHIRGIDERLMRHNMFWLLFIVTLPFSASLISADFNDTPPMFVYCLNTFLITLMQNFIWDHVAVRPALLKEHTDKALIHHYRVTCNIAMINGLLAMAATPFSPRLAFALLVVRLPMILFLERFFKYKRK